MINIRHTAIVTEIGSIILALTFRCDGIQDSTQYGGGDNADCACEQDCARVHDYAPNLA